MPNEKKAKSKCVEYLRHAEYYDMQNTFDELYARSQAGEIFDGLMMRYFREKISYWLIGTSNPTPGVLHRERIS